MSRVRHHKIQQATLEKITPAARELKEEGMRNIISEIRFLHPNSHFFKNWLL